MRSTLLALCIVPALVGCQTAPNETPCGVALVAGTMAAAFDASAAHADDLADPEEQAWPGVGEGRIVLLVPGTTIRGSYFGLMAQRLERDGFQPVIYEPADLFTGSLADGAAGIGARVQALLQQTGQARISIVAECDGGVATRYFLQVLGGHRWVDRAVTFVSAHNGTSLAPLAAWTTGWQALADITPGSGFLETLNAAPFPDGLQLTSIYSAHDGLMCPPETSEVEGAVNIRFEEHVLGHFDGFWDRQVYARILYALLGEDGPRQVF